MGRGKKPRAARRIEPIVKIPRVSAPDIGSFPFCWRMNDVDWDGPWGWQKVTTVELIRTIIPKLHDYETMTWAQVDGPSGSHFVDFEQLCSEAQRRLSEIGKTEQAQLFSLRMTGPKRIWGIRDVKILRLLWWDPEHSVCPSMLKNT